MGVVESESLHRRAKPESLFPITNVPGSQFFPFFYIFPRTDLNRRWVEKAGDSGHPERCRTSASDSVYMTGWILRELEDQGSP